MIFDKKKPELDIIKACKKGSLKNQEMLYKRFYGYAISIALRYCYAQEEAVEVLNDSFLKVFDNIKKFDTNNSFKAWLRRIIINTSIDYYRKRRKFRNNVELEAAENTQYDFDAVAQMSVDDILGLLNQLPEMYRLTFNLYEIEGYSHHEIGEKLNISPGTSRSNLSRAKEILRKACKKHFKEAYEAVV